MPLANSRLGPYSVLDDLPHCFRVENTFLTDGPTANSSRRELRQVSTDGDAPLPSNLSILGSQQQHENISSQHLSTDEDTRLEVGVRQLNLDEDMGSPPDPPPQQSQMYCPVLGCAASDSSRHAGWLSMQALRAHVDSHMLGQMPGRPSSEWLQQHRLQGWSDCGRLVSSTVGNGMHRRCRARRASTTTTRRESTVSAPVDDGSPKTALLQTLPSIEQICERQVPIREYLEPDLCCKCRKGVSEVCGQCCTFLPYRCLEVGGL